MRAAAPIILPFAIAIFLAILSLPLLRTLRRIRMPIPLAVGVVVLANMALLGFLGLIVSRSFGEFVVALPRYMIELQHLVDRATAGLQQRGVVAADWVARDLVNTAAVMDIVATTLRSIATVLSNAFLVLIILTFVLAEVSGFPSKLRAALGRADVDLGRFARITHEVQHFLGIKTLTSLATGTLVGFWTAAMGVDFPVLWGLLAFLLNYIPAVGSILAAIPAIIIALIQLGLSRAAVVALGYLSINIVIGNLIEPNLMGRRLGLSPLVVVASLIFWGWVLGPIGMFLSVPLTVIVKITLENTEDLRWLAILLDSPREVPSKGGAPPPPMPLSG
jgi:AI-2 transport protein TqsA